MRHHRITFGCVLALGLGSLVACAKAPVAAGVGPVVTIDRAPVPKRYSAPLPFTAQGLHAWEEGDPALPPVGHVVDHLLAGDAGMFKRLQRSAKRVPADQTLAWAEGWQSLTRLRVASEAFCAQARPVMAGTASGFRDALSGAFAANCRKPEDAALLLRADTPYWAVLEAYEDLIEVNPTPPPFGQVLVDAAQQAIDKGNRFEAWGAALTLARRPEPEAWAALHALQKRVPPGELADELATSFYLTGDPALHAIAARVCAGMDKQHYVCEEGPRKDSPGAALEAPPKDTAAAVESARAQLVSLGFSRLEDSAARTYEHADPTRLLTQAGYVHAFDAETGRFPNEHEAVLRPLAQLVQPALDGAVFEEVFPTDENGAYTLVAYLDGKRYRTPAQNRGDWYDVDAVLRLLEAMLEERGRPERFASLYTRDQVALIVGGPRSAVDGAISAGLLQPGDSDQAERHGKASEAFVRKLLEAEQ